MSIAELFIRRPVMTTLVSMAFLLFGVLAYRQLPVSDLPNVDFPTILVSASLPGANPETMASAVATPLERQFTTIAGLDSMSSTNSLGLTNITLQFTLERNIDAAAQDVQTSIAQTLGQLPQDMPSPPSYRKVNPADQPILYMSLVSPTLPLSTVDEYAETFVAQRISMVSGVAQVNVLGAQKYAVRMQADPKALASRGIGIDEVADAIRRGNVNLPTGVLWGAHQSFTVQSSGQLLNAEAYRPLIVTYRDGRPVRLSELGRVIDSVENDKVASWYGDKTGQRRGILLSVQRQPGTNTVEVVDGIRALIPTFRAQMPEAVELKILYDRSATIRNSVDDVKFTLLLTVFLVVMVIFIFLRNLSATIIPSLALPMSIVGTFAFMYLLGFSVDNLSLMALTLSVGFVVDDAIVMLENIVRHMERGEPPMQASFEGSSEIAFTILSMTTSLVAVFIPVLFMGGIMGRLLHEFAVTITAAILVSGFVSLTLTPMLCSRFLRSPESERHGHLYEVTERWFHGLLGAYRVSLKSVMRHRRATMIVLGLLLVGTVYLFRAIPKGFLPTEDNGQIITFTRGPQGISFDAMKQHQMALNAIAAHDPATLTFFSGVGAMGPTGTLNSGILFAHLKPRSERGAIDQVINRWRAEFAAVPGLVAFPQNPPAIRIGARFTESQYQITLQSPNTTDLYHYGSLLESKMRAMPELRGVTSDLQMQT